MRSLPSSEAHGGPVGEVDEVAVREAAVVPVETLGVMGWRYYEKQGRRRGGEGGVRGEMWRGSVEG